MFVIYSPEHLAKIERPVIFLAGPIIGASHWQAEALDLLSAFLRKEGLEDKVIVACPRREEQEREQETFSQQQLQEQVDWQIYFLELASRQGVVLFWLAKEAHHNYPLSYAQTWCFELGRMAERCLNGQARLVLGIEMGFSAERYLRYFFSRKLPEMNIFHTLEGTCQAAVTLVKNILKA